MHANNTLTSLGKLDTLPFGVGLRGSIEWHLRSNGEKAEAAAESAAGQTTHREALLDLLPSQEAKFRREIFWLEDQVARAATEKSAREAESTQVTVA